MARIKQNTRRVIPTPSNSAPLNGQISQSVEAGDTIDQGRYYERHLPPNSKLWLYGPYAISREGGVFSFLKGKWLKPMVNDKGYLSVFLISYDGVKPRWHKVHRLVATMFLYNQRPKKAKEVHHRDKNKENNNVKNLKWVTHSENILFDYQSGMRKKKMPMKGKKQTDSTKRKMSIVKTGELHPKFKGWYVWEGRRHASLTSLAAAMGTYNQKAYRLVKRGKVEFVPKEIVPSTQPLAA
jgi:hypothetical protein